MITFRTPTEERFAFKFGNQKINVHEWGKEFTPRAHVAAPGTLDLCFIASIPLAEVVKRLQDNRIPIVEGPVAKTGAITKYTSDGKDLYIRWLAKDVGAMFLAMAV